MAWFLIVYDRKRQRTTRCDEYSASEYDAAWSARNELTLEHARDPDVEVVLLGSGSADEVRRTHARYFQASPS